MRYLLLFLLFSSCQTQLVGQVKHEVKMPFLEVLGLNFQPSYEMVSKNERISVELGIGIDFSKSSFRSNLDTMLPFGQFVEPEKFKQRVFRSELAFKYYWYKIVDEKYLSFFVGPGIAYERYISFEDEYLQKQNEFYMMRNLDNPYFVGKSEIRPGANIGGKLILKNNLLIEVSALLSVVIEERTPSIFSLRRAYTEVSPSIKIGYRFGEHPNTKTQE